MNDSLDKALHYLTGNGNIDAVTTEDLEKLVEDHPYFPVAHFLLSKKLKKQNSTNFLSEVQKTALYFPNPYWLHYQLLNDVPHEPIIYDGDEHASSNGEHVIENEMESSPDTFISREEDNHLPQKPNDTIEEHPITTEFTPEEIEAASLLAHKVLVEKDEAAAGRFETDTQVADDESTLNDVPTIDDNSAITQGEVIEYARQDDADTRPEISDEMYDEPSIKEEEKVIEFAAAKSEEPLELEVELKPSEHLLPDHQEPATQVEEEMAAITRDVDETAIHFVEEVAAEQTAHDIDDTEEVPSNNENAEPEDDEHEKMFQNIKAMLDASAEEANAGVKSTIVPIDPYYTIDYFAAQGIKLDLEKNPQDKLGKQVKKFTQWLKHMKKLGPEDALAAEKPSPAEVEAQTIADASNIAREVVTEAMALVLEKQGKKDKAIQLYRKLTFLNPHKSAYFADKIDHLNGL
jgi:hypothetical protein